MIDQHHYLDKEKILKMVGYMHGKLKIYAPDLVIDELENQIEYGNFDVIPVIGEGYILVSIEDYNNKTKLLREKDAEITRLKINNGKKARPCDCPYERNGCTYSGYCKYRRAPDKDLNGTWLPTCGVRFPEEKTINPNQDETGDLDDFYEQQSAAARSPNGMA